MLANNQVPIPKHVLKVLTSDDTMAAGGYCKNGDISCFVTVNENEITLNTGERFLYSTETQCKDCFLSLLDRSIRKGKLRNNDCLVFDSPHQLLK